VPTVRWQTAEVITPKGVYRVQGTQTASDQWRAGVVNADGREWPLTSAVIGYPSVLQMTSDSVDRFYN
jgi:hypothetical protein